MDVVNVGKPFDPNGPKELMGSSSDLNAADSKPKKRVTIIYKSPAKQIRGKVIQNHQVKTGNGDGAKRTMSFRKMTPKEFKLDTPVDKKVTKSSQKLKGKKSESNETFHSPLPKQRKDEVVSRKKSVEESPKEGKTTAMVDNLHLLSNVADALRTMADEEKRFLEKTRSMLNKRQTNIKTAKKPRSSACCFDDHNYSVSLTKNDYVDETDRKIASSYIKKVDGDDSKYTIHTGDTTGLRNKTVKPKVIVLPKKRVKYVTSFNSSIVSPDIRKGLLGKDAKADLTDRLRMALRKNKTALAAGQNSSGETVFKVTLVSVPGSSSKVGTPARILHSNISQPKDLKKISELVSSLQRNKPSLAVERMSGLEERNSRQATVVPMGSEDAGWLSSSLDGMQQGCDEMPSTSFSSEDRQSTNTDNNISETGMDSYVNLTDDNPGSNISLGSSDGRETKNASASRIIVIQSGSSLQQDRLPKSKCDEIPEASAQQKNEVLETSDTTELEGIHVTDNISADICRFESLQSVDSKTEDVMVVSENEEDLSDTSNRTAPVAVQGRSLNLESDGVNTASEMAVSDSSETSDVCKIVLWESADNDSLSSDSLQQDFAISVEPLASENVGDRFEMPMLGSKDPVLNPFSVDGVCEMDSSDGSETGLGCSFEPSTSFSSALRQGTLSCEQQANLVGSKRKHLYSLADRILKQSKF